MCLRAGQFITLNNMQEDGRWWRHLWSALPHAGQQLAPGPGLEQERDRGHLLGLVHHQAHPGLVRRHLHSHAVIQSLIVPKVNQIEGILPISMPNSAIFCSFCLVLILISHYPIIGYPFPSQPYVQ